LEKDVSRSITKRVGKLPNQAREKEGRKMQKEEKN
jgi:hypothetical protein